MWKIALNIFAVLILVFAVIYQVNYGAKDQTYDARSMGARGAEFELMSDEGPKSLEDFAGKTVVIYFGFTACPDVCPMALSYLKGVLRDFPSSDQVQVVFVSVDHKRDTPESVAKYARYFDKDFVGLTGSKKQIDQVVQNYNVYYKFIEMEESQMGYTVDHTSRFFIIDKYGQLQKAVHSAEDPEIFREVLSSVVN